MRDWHAAEERADSFHPITTRAEHVSQLIKPMKICRAEKHTDTFGSTWAPLNEKRAHLKRQKHIWSCYAIFESGSNSSQ